MQGTIRNRQYVDGAQSTRRWSADNTKVGAQSTYCLSPNLTTPAHVRAYARTFLIWEVIRGNYTGSTS